MLPKSKHGCTVFLPRGASMSNHELGNTKVTVPLNLHKTMPCNRIKHAVPQNKTKPTETNILPPFPLSTAVDLKCNFLEECQSRLRQNRLRSSQEVAVRQLHVGARPRIKRFRVQIPILATTFFNFAIGSGEESCVSSFRSEDKVSCLSSD